MTKECLKQIHEMLLNRYPKMWTKDRLKPIWNDCRDLDDDVFVRAVKSHITDSRQTRDNQPRGCYPPCPADIHYHALAAEEQIHREQKERINTYQQTLEQEAEVIPLPDAPHIGHVHNFQVGEETLTIQVEKVYRSRCHVCADSGWAKYYSRRGSFTEVYLPEEVAEWSEEQWEGLRISTAICSCDHPKAIHHREAMSHRIPRWPMVQRWIQERQDQEQMMVGAQ